MGLIIIVTRVRVSCVALKAVVCKLSLGAVKRDKIGEDVVRV